MARRVFPQPPGPVNVTSRAVSKSSASSATSRSRPMKLEIAFGRLCRAPGAVRGAGKSPGRSGCCNWNRSWGSGKSLSRKRPIGFSDTSGGTRCSAWVCMAFEVRTWPPCAAAEIRAA